MKKALPLLLFVFYSSFFVPSAFAFKAEPLPRSPFVRREIFDTNLTSGSSVYSYPVPVPKGTNGLTPDVSLHYNSGAARSPIQYAGQGWSIGSDYIERDTRYSFDSGNDMFKLNFQGNSYDLVFNSTTQRYHTKIESNMHVQWLTSGGLAQSGYYWQVITPDGTKYRFGYRDGSELVCSHNSFVDYWKLDEVEDVFGNKIFYTYTEEQSNGLSYLSKIEYNTEKARVIDFTYENHPYQREWYSGVCKQKETKRLAAIDVKANTSLVRRINFNYGTAGNSQSQLVSLTETGSATTSALPATTFTYANEIKSWASSSATWIDNASVDAHLAQTQHTAMADINGDGLLDIVRSEQNGGNNTWKALLNLGNSWATSFTTWATNAPMDAYIGKSDTAFVDVTGDGRPEIVRSERNGCTVDWKVWRNVGTSYPNTPEWWIQNQCMDTYIGQSGTTLADVDGDGLVDIVKTFVEGSNNHDIWRIYKNKGTHWDPNYETWINSYIDTRISHNFVRLIDVTGDGLPDIVRTTTGGEWRVYKNTGHNWNTNYETWIQSSSNVGAHLEMQEVAMSDVNGDGLTDIVKSTDGGNQDTWKVLLNSGNSWLTTWETWIQPSDNVDADVQTDNTRLMDVDGDNLPDIVKTEYNGGNDTWKVWKNNGYAPNLLTKITTSKGATIDFEYTISAGLDNTGSDALSDMPFTLWVVDERIDKNGMTGDHATTDVTEYTYANGFHDWADHEFRGFGSVTEIAPNGAKKAYTFHQTDDLKGKMERVVVSDTQNNRYAETEHTYTSSFNNPIYTVTLTEEKQFTFDGAASNPKIRETDYAYDSYGNITKKSEHGDISVSGDERFTYIDYTTPNTSAWIVDKAKRTYVHSSNDSTKVSETKFYYDNNSSIDTAPEKGAITKEERWLSGGSNPVTLFEYDSYGNVVEVTDPNDGVTTYSFGTNDGTHTYPDSMTNAKSQTTTTDYDLGTGNVEAVTDSNGLATTYEYDVFGRVVKEIKPYDSSNYPTVAYTYSFDGTAPESTKVSKREVGGASGTLDIYTFVDGFGRTVQTRTDAEDTTKQLVVNTYYHETGQVEKQSVSHLDTSSTSYVTPVGGIRSTDMTYDVLGRSTAITNPKGDTKSIAYDHWKETSTDENGHVKKQYRNAFGKIHKVEEVNSGSTYTTNYTYDSFDQLTGITDNENNVSTLTYDTLGRKISQADPDMGTWTYAYDDAGNITSQTDARGITITKTYDELHRITKVDYPNDTDSTFAYDIGKKGTISIATDSAGTVSFTYDNRLRKTQEQRIVNGTTKTTQFSYDAADRVVTQTNPDGEVIAFAFNNQGQVDSASGSASLVSNIDYNALNKITSKSFGNSLTTNYTYNSDDFRLNRIQTGSIQDQNFTYDAVGNIASRVHNLASKTELFSYDDLDRLKTASESAAGYSYTYAYNSLGNLTKFTNAGIDTDYSYGQTTGVHALRAEKNTTTPLKIHTITDDWSGGSISSAKWNNWSSTQNQVINGQVKITSTLTSGYYGMDSIPSGPRDFTGSYATNQVISAGNQSLTSWGVFPVVIGKTTDTHQVFWAIEGNKIKAFTNINGTYSVVSEITYNSSTHKYFRVREQSGKIYWDYSASGLTWTNLTSLINPFDMTSVKVAFDVGTWQNESSTTFAVFDNFSTLPTLPLSEMIADDWSRGSVNTTKWNIWNSTQTSVSSSQLVLQSVLAGGYFGVDGKKHGKVFNLTSSYVSNKLVNAGNQSLSSWQVFPILIQKPNDGSNQLLFYVSNNSIVARKVVSGSSTNIQTASYNATNHKYFRIRENKGTIYWDTSSDGSSWTNFTSLANPFDISQVDVGQMAGTWQAEGSTTSATFDNFNELPAMASLAEDWSTGYIDPAKWNNWGGVQINVTNQQASLSSSLTSAYRGMDLKSNGTAYNMTNGSIVQELVDAGNQSIQSWEVYPVYVYTSGDDDYAYYWLVSQNTIRAYKRVANTNTQLWSTSYNSSAHKWFRVREAGGTIYFDTSVDGGTWTNHTSTSTPFPVTSMTSSLLIGTWQNETSVTTAKFDNFNAMVNTYDANGNLSTDGVTCYEYNDANQMVKVKKCTTGATIAEYVYDYNGNRMVKKVYTHGMLDETTTSWSDSFETKVSGGTTQNTTYYFVNNELIAKKNPDGSRYFFHNDHLGSTTIISNQSGTLVEETKYDPWGVVTVGGTKSKFLYTGQEYDNESSLHYYNARYYDPTTRHFTQPDDIIQDAFDPQTLNRYSYVRNSPLRYTDPSGHYYQYIPGVMFLTGGVALSILEVGGGVYGAVTSPDTTLQGRLMYGLAGAQNAVESPAGQLAYDIAFLGLSMANGYSEIKTKPAATLSTQNNNLGTRGVRYYNNMTTFRRHEGSAGKGNQWGHLVEQNSSNIDKFGKQPIHNTGNVIKMPTEVNQAMNAVYSSKDAYGQIIRKKINELSYEQQKQFAREQYKIASRNYKK